MKFLFGNVFNFKMIQEKTKFVMLSFPTVK